MIRTILSPGVELNEVDKSQYNPTTIDTFRVLLPGFASKGKIALPTTITSMTQFKDEFGVPTNEAERYAFNAANIILNDGGEVVFAKLPYTGELVYPSIKYSLSPSSTISGDISAISATDPTITSQISFSKTDEKLLTEAEFNDLVAPSSTTATSSFTIVDITNSEYGTYTSDGSKTKCLGIMPVVTTAVNAMAIASQLSGVNMYSADPSASTTINPFESLSDSIEYFTDVSTTSATPDNWLIPANTLSAGNTIQSISKNAAEFFPTISYSASSNANTDVSAQVYDRTYFSYIGVVVYQIEVDVATGCLQAVPIEAFTGSLIKEAVDINTNATVYIENIINNRSKYIRLYASIKDEDLQTKGTILYSEPSTGVILNKPTTDKKIVYSTITESLDDIFNSQSNVLNTIIDVVCDAGVSTIAQFISETTAGQEFTPDTTSTSISSTADTAQWRAIIEKFKGFCQNARKDCVFITESPRHFSIKGRNKIVDGTNASITVGKNITPNIKYISGINSSYGWGYSVWYRIADAHSGKLFWMPPSAFGTGIYVRTRRNFNVWDAPAGINRATISVADTSFEPDLQARNALYSNAWNYSLTYVNQGTVLEGQKTFQTKASAFDRIIVRSLFIYLERRVFNIARNYIYEPNTAYTRQQFIDSVKPMLESVKAAGGLYDYRIIADETLNTPEIIDANEFRIRIGLKPTKTIEFIMIEFVALRTGSTFTELV